METRTIDSRDGVEVYVGANGHVCIHQDRIDDDVVVIFHREDVPELIEYLKASYQEAVDFVSEQNTEPEAAGDAKPRA